MSLKEGTFFLKQIGLISAPNRFLLCLGDREIKIAGWSSQDGQDCYSEAHYLRRKITIEVVCEEKDFPLGDTICEYLNFSADHREHKILKNVTWDGESSVAFNCNPLNSRTQSVWRFYWYVSDRVNSELVKHTEAFLAHMYRHIAQCIEKLIDEGPIKLQFKMFQHQNIERLILNDEEQIITIAHTEKYKKGVVVSAKTRCERLEDSTVHAIIKLPVENHHFRKGNFGIAEEFLFPHANLFPPEQFVHSDVINDETGGVFMHTKIFLVPDASVQTKIRDWLNKKMDLLWDNVCQRAECYELYMSV